jgi:methyl-accepting chemotaxis protein
LQVLTEAVPFLELTLQPLQEQLLATDQKMTFCAAVDRNGYLPVHNLVFSKPQKPDDPVWNAANARNRRIFDDRAGLAAARNTRPFLVQAYRRDMGGGVTVLMKEIDAPITVRGRHWGGFRTAYKA